MQKRNTQKSPQKNAEKEHAEETHKRGAKEAQKLSLLLKAYA